MVKCRHSYICMSSSQMWTLSICLILFKVLNVCAVRLTLTTRLHGGHHGYSTERGEEAGEAGEWLGSRKGRAGSAGRALCPCHRPPPHPGGVPALLSFALWHVQGLSPGICTVRRAFSKRPGGGGVAIQLRPLPPKTKLISKQASKPEAHQHRCVLQYGEHQDDGQLHADNPGPKSPVKQLQRPRTISVCKCTRKVITYSVPFISVGLT